MRITRSFVVVAAVAVVPFGLAIRQDLQRKDQVDHDRSAAIAHELQAYEPADPPADDPGLPSDYGRRDVDVDDVPSPVASGGITPADLAAIIGDEPATTGPLLRGIAIGSSSESFLPEATRVQLEAYKVDHELDIDFDFDDVALNGFTVRMSGEEGVLRDAMIALWGMPRRLAEDELVWLGAGSQRAVYRAMSDGADLRFEKFATVDEIIAPSDKARLGVEPFPLLGATRKKLEQAIGPRLQDTGARELSWAQPGIGNGAGKTMVKATLADDDRIEGVVVEGATDDVDAVRDAMVRKWGTPVEEDGLLTWTRKGVTITAEVWEHGFSITIGRGH